MKNTPYSLAKTMLFGRCFEIPLFKNPFCETLPGKRFSRFVPGKDFLKGLFENLFQKHPFLLSNMACFSEVHRPFPVSSISFVKAWTNYPGKRSWNPMLRFTGFPIYSCMVADNPNFLPPDPPPCPENKDIPEPGIPGWSAPFLAIILFVFLYVVLFGRG